MKVSIIIPAYNCANYIQGAVNSILWQTYKDFEVIVIDDGSTDNTPEILNKYGDRIKWKSQGHRGQASALNAGIKLAVGEYIALLDGDDMCLPERFEVEARYLDEHPDVGLVYSDRYEIDEHGKVKSVIKSVPLDKFLLLQHNYIARSSVMLRRDCLEKVGLFDEDNTGNDDWDMWVRFSEHFHMCYIEKPLIKYRIHDRNISRTRPKKLNHYRLTRLRMLEKTYERRGKPRWLNVLLLRARLEWLIGRVSWLGENFPKVWWRAGKMLNLIESLFVERLFLRGR